jgi:peptide/nickel transport system substrate-binding protein
VLPQWGSAVQNYLHAVGIRAKLNQLQTGSPDPARQGGRAAACISEAGAAFRSTTSRRFCPNFFDGGADDYARDPDVQKGCSRADRP